MGFVAGIREEILAQIKENYREITNAQNGIDNQTYRNPDELRLLHQNIIEAREKIDELSSQSVPEVKEIMRKLLIDSRRNTILLRILTHSELKSIRDELLAADIDLSLMSRRRISFEKYADEFPVTQEQKNLLEKYSYYQEYIFKNLSQNFRSTEKQKFIDDFCWAMSEDFEWKKTAAPDEDYEQTYDALSFVNCCFGVGLEPIIVRKQFKNTLKMSLDELIHFFIKYLKKDAPEKKTLEEDDY